MSHKNLSDLPKSCTNLAICHTGLVGFIITIFFIRKNPHISNFDATVLASLALSVPIMVLDVLFLKVYKRPSTGLDWAIKRRWDFERIIVKIIGLYITFATVAIFYQTMPVYSRPFYTPYWSLVYLVMPSLLILSIPYMAILDRFMVRPRDGYWHIGKLALGSWSLVNLKIVAQHLLGWLVKAFFLPLMFIYMVQNMDYLRFVDISQAFSSFEGMFHFSWQWLFAIDYAYVVPGYIFTLRLFDTHIRSAEPTFFGWLVAVACYEPFWNCLSYNYFRIDDGYGWMQWLAPHPSFQIFWGTIILLLLACYSWSTVAFGLHFSNLTHRGIITGGTYRYTKHPAYVSKNILWWFTFIPFIPNQGVSEALRYCLMLLGINLIYFLRAKTEERHLSWDPIYVEYALAMNERSIFSPLVRVFPFLRYRKPEKPILQINQSN